MSDVEPGPDRTRMLLREHFNGSGTALEQLLADHLPFLERHARRQLGARLRRKDDPEDIVQSSVRELLQYGPRFEIADGAQFRALLARIVQRVVLHRDRWYKQKRRAMHREATQAGQSAALLDCAMSQTAPSERAAKTEEDGMLRLALEFLEPADREVIVRRAFDEESFAAIGVALGISEDAATKRYRRALPRLAEQMRELESGRATDISRLD